MTLDVQKQPYELLVRWANGTLSGASMSWLLVTTDGDEVKGAVIDGPHPVTDDNANGSFLDEILSLVQRGALASAEAAKADCEQHFQHAEAARNEAAEWKEKFDLLTLEVENLDTKHQLSLQSSIRLLDKEHEGEIAAMKARIAELEALQ